jgi:predicted TIM-barrel enzyme
VTLFEGRYRQGLEETGMGLGLEVEMIRLARKLDLFTTPYAVTVDEAKAMAEAGADVLVAHLGLTTKGSIGASTAVPLNEAPGKVQEICDAAKRVNPNIICLCHGGPLAEPEDAEYEIPSLDLRAEDQANLRRPGRPGPEDTRAAGFLRRALFQWGRPEQRLHPRLRDDLRRRGQP